MKFAFNLLVLFAFIPGILIASPLKRSHPENESEKSKKIDSFMTALYGRGQFTGAILVADHGKVIYKKAFGDADRQNKMPFTLLTQEYIGSISKQFTAMGIMILNERGKLDYGQPIRSLFPELPACMQPVTIRDLLYHTSGLAIFDDYPNMTEKDVFDILLKQKTLRFKPGERFEYCNAGYSLLGMIIAKVSGQTLNEFMTVNIFKPLAMFQTSVNEITRPNKTRAVGYNIYGDINSYDTYMGGNACMISTVEDLYKWDQALYHFTLVKPATLAEAFTPSNMVMNDQALLLKDDVFGDKSYGFGWWIGTHDNAPDLFHDGAFSGYQSYIERLTGEKESIIYLSNMRLTVLLDIRSAIVNILAGRGYRMPKIPVSMFIARQSAALGSDSAIDLYRHLKSTADPSYDFSEVILNSFGYVLLRSNRVDEAIKIFKLNIEAYPNSGNVYDGLADGYLKAGDKTSALQCYKKELLLDPNNGYVKDQIKTLEAGQ